MDGSAEGGVYARVQWYGGVHVGVRVACLVSSFVVGLVLDGCVW